MWLVLVPVCWGMAGCFTSPSNPDAVREHTADATAALKSDAKAMAQGIHEGWTRDHPLNINTASKEELMRLPGVGTVTAERMIAERPYAAPGELLTRHVVSKVEYDRIAGRVKVR